MNTPRTGMQRAFSQASYPAPSARAVLWDEDFNDAAPFTSGAFITGSAGGGTTVVGGEATAPGLASPKVTAAADRANHNTAITSLTFDASLRLLDRFRIRVPILSVAAGEQFILREGFGDNGAGDQVDGAYIEWDAGVTANVQCKVAANSVRTTVDSGVAWLANTWHDVTIIGNANAVLFYFDRSLVATVTSNIPVGAARVFGGMGHAIKVAGVAARQYDLDYNTALALFDTARGAALEAS